jgi:hypothetical protein
MMTQTRRPFPRRRLIDRRRVPLPLAASARRGGRSRVAQQLVDGGFTARYDYAFQALSGLPYDRWRDYDAEDTVRFYALRLYDAGLIKSDPNKIVAENTDWHFLDELKRELKA